MPQFSPQSRAKLDGCDARLRTLFDAVIEVVDCTILDGHRNRAAQDAAFTSGKSKTPWPRSKHNRTPSLAVDAAPYPINFDDRERLTLFAGLVLGMAAAHGVALRWGGDWDCDFQVRDNGFDDLVHFELRDD